MKKFDFEYLYSWSPMRYHKIIEAESLYEAHSKFVNDFPEPYICICNTNEIK